MQKYQNTITELHYLKKNAVTYYETYHTGTWGHVEPESSEFGENNLI